MYLVAEYDHIVSLGYADQGTKFFGLPGPAERVMRIADHDRFGIGFFTELLVSGKIQVPVVVFVTDQIATQRYPFCAADDVKKILINRGENDHAFTRTRDIFKHQMQRT